MDPIKPFKGRGATFNPGNRFEEIEISRDSECDEPDDPAPGTRFYRDRTRSLITYNDSPDLGFMASFNPYRGCEHGCIYCYARPYHEYLGLSAGVDFETKIFVKEDAPMLLRKELASPRWKPTVLAVSGVTDCYQPAERRFQITRRCMEVLAESRNPAGIISKNALVARDIDIFQDMARWKGIWVTLSITSLDPLLASVMEPRASAPKARLAAVEKLAKTGVSVGVNIAPVIPGLNDHEIPAILKAARAAGASSAGYTLLRLPYALKDLFEQWLEHHRPLAKDKILHRIREVRGGELYDSRFGKRMRGEGEYAERLIDFFKISRKKAGFPESTHELSTAYFRRPPTHQLEFFEV